MSKAGKILFLFSFLAFFLLGAARLVYGGWHPSFWVPLVLMIVLFIGGVARDRAALKELLTMRSTKHGMNLGVLIVTVVVAIVCVNYLADRYDKKFDWTSDRLNSLSEQSVKAAQSLKADTELILIYRKEANDQENVQRAVADLAAMYQNVTNKIKFTAYSGLQRPDLAQKYDFTFGSHVFYAVQGERKVKIDPPTEEGVTRALIKLGREKKKTIYFTRGHGELILDGKDPAGLSILKEDLEITYDVKPLALFETGEKVPDDADAVAVVGPHQQFLETELQGLRDYARRGGHIFLALDPGSKQNLGLLTKTFGVEFDNDYVLDLRSRALQGSPSLVLGTDFSRTSDITKAFKSEGNQIALFELASSLKKAPDAPASLSIDALIRSDKSTAAIPELKDKVEYRPNGPHTLAMTVKGHLPASPDGKTPEGKEMSVVIYGDSDFLANRLIHNNLNRDLVDNSFAWLTNDNDLITIRPKEPKGTHLEMPTGSYYALALALLMITIGLFGSGIGFWWRRRTA